MADPVDNLTLHPFLLLCIGVDFLFALLFPRDALKCKPQHCHRMSSVRPSVTLVIPDHVGRESAKQLSQISSQTYALLACKNRDLTLGEHTEILGQIGGGYFHTKSAVTRLVYKKQPPCLHQTESFLGRPILSTNCAVRGQKKE